MKILVLNGSPGPQGSTSGMIKAFREGAEKAGHEVSVIASPIYYHGVSGQLKCALDRFYSVAYPTKPKNLRKAAMILSSGDANMYDGAMFSYQGDFLDFLGLEDMGVFTAHGGENHSQKMLERLRTFGESL
ncbi:MAG: NAD(P)H-dependent oxidoreductase [Lachnospiraceae bacterium]|nr:NAD(P)H-dependent oxidoreductase [Lachnospiraceae bacterium]